MLGTTIRDRYKIIKYLDNSSLGETYLAEDIYLPNNGYCIIKRINSNLNTSFTTEIAKFSLNNKPKIFNSLENYNQIPKLLADFEENNEFYLVYEFIEGKPITPKFTTPKLEAEKAVCKKISPQQAFLRNWSRSEIIILMVLLITSIACITSLARLRESINLVNKNQSEVAINQQSFRLTPKVLIYQNFQNGIKIKYPKNWERQDIYNPVTGEVAIFIPPEESDSAPSQTKIIIRVEDLSKKPISLDEYTNSSILEIKKFLSNARIVESKQTTLAKLPAHLLIYSGLKEPYSLPTNLEVWTLKNNKAYIITYTSTSAKYNQFLEIAKEIIKSLEIS